jgi:hypothetical protein
MALRSRQAYPSPRVPYSRCIRLAGGGRHNPSSVCSASDSRVPPPGRQVMRAPAGRSSSMLVDTRPIQSRMIRHWICTERGLAVVVGCSHAGLVNTLRRAVTSSGEPRLHAVVGGFLLNEASEQRLARTTDGLQELGPDLIVPCHCSGDAAVTKLGRTFGERVLQGSAGATFRFGGHPAITPVGPPLRRTSSGVSCPDLGSRVTFQDQDGPVHGTGGEWHSRRGRP